MIVDEELYDKEFVDNHIHGWEPFLKVRLEEFPLERVEEITWVDRELIKKAARIYAETKPAGIHWGVPTEQTINCTDYTRTAVALMAITGNLDAPGGNVFHQPPPVRKVAEFSAHTKLSPEQRAKRLGGDQYKLAARMTFITPKCAWDAILTGKPYPVKAGYLVGTNPVITRANAREVYKALSKLDFLAVSDFFLTPTAELADVFLPAGTWLEQDHMADNWKFHGYVLARQKVVQIGECWQDHKIFMELGKRMGQEWWDTVEDAPGLAPGAHRIDLGGIQEKRISQGRGRLLQIPGKGILHPHPQGGDLLHHPGGLGRGPSAQIHRDPGKPCLAAGSKGRFPLYPQLRAADPHLFPLGQPPGSLAQRDPA